MFNTQQMYYSDASHAIPKQSFESQFALVFHSVNHQTVVTKHNISKDKILTGMIVEPIDVIQSTLSETKSESSTDSWSDILDERVLIDDYEKIIWYSKATNRQMWFFGRDCGKATLRVWWPNLLFVVNKKLSSMKVFALATGARPSVKTRLYQAPLMNINDGGKVCLGSAHLPKDKSHTNIVAMENCIYDSNFSHLNDYGNNEQSHMRCDKEHVNFYRMREKNNQKFKANEMTFLCRLSDVL